MLSVILTNCKRERDNPPIPDLDAGFSVTNFSKSPILTIRKNSQQDGAAMRMSYSVDQPEAEIGTTEHFKIDKGFESTFTFSGKAPYYLQIRLFAQDGSLYNPYGISTAFDQNVFNVGHTQTNIKTDSLMPSLFDGKKHTVRIQVRNQSESGLVTTIFVDNLNQAVFEAADTTAFARKELYGSGPRANRRVSLLFFGNGPASGEAMIYDWSFKPL
ncbi:hypothetical protein ACO2Q8_14900 [Larkinella sp. VNQ87]|uniref:hypothetical protein n=1 Tax=Larkinella sp. VNQ87 TaxID=3400921 RepID=UPI003C0C32C3